MTRTFLGYKPGVGGVLKILKNDAHDPLTHPSDDFGAFLFDSERAAIGYGDHYGTQTVVPRSLTWVAYQEVDNWIGGQILARTQGAGTDYGWLSLYANPSGIWPNLNSFYFVTTQDSGWKQAWSSFGGTYSGSSDKYHVTRRGSVERYQDMIVPVKTNGAWSAAGYGYLDPSSTATDVNYPPSLIWDPSGKPVTSSHLDYMPNRTYSFYGLDLPVDESPYPTVSPGTPVSGQKIISLSPSAARMSKAGYDVDLATHDQLIFDSNKLPMKVVRTGVVTIAQGGVVSVPLGEAFDTSIFVDYLVRRTDVAHIWLPAWPEDLNQFINVQYRINGTSLEFYNTSTLTVEVRYVVMAADSLSASSGSKPTYEATPEYTVFRKPNTGGSRFKDTIVDSRLAYLPVIAQGWVPFSSFSGSGGNQAGTHQYSVGWNNTGNFKPYVLAKVARQNKNNPSQIVYQDLYGKYIEIYTYFADSSFMCALNDTGATFYVSDGSRFEDAYRKSSGYGLRYSSYTTVGIRYYVFAIPTSL